MAKVNHRSHYASVFTQWQGKVLGPQPTEAQLATVHAFKRAGGKEALGMAMALRDGGMTAKQMTGASSLFDGNPTTCRNTIKRFIEAGMFDGGSEGGVIHITLTKRGQGWVDRAAEALAAKVAAAPKGKADSKAAVKAKGKRKPRKVTEPVIEAPAQAHDGHDLTPQA